MAIDPEDKRLLERLEDFLARHGGRDETYDPTPSRRASKAEAAVMAYALIMGLPVNPKEELDYLVGDCFLPDLLHYARMNGIRLDGYLLEARAAYMKQILDVEGRPKPGETFECLFCLDWANTNGTHEGGLNEQHEPVAASPKLNRLCSHCDNSVERFTPHGCSSSDY